MTQRERQEHAKKTIFQAALAEFGAQRYRDDGPDLFAPRDLERDDVSLFFQQG